MKSIITGLVFGAALFQAQVYDPNVIKELFRLESLFLIRTFLLATTLSVVTILIFNAIGWINPSPRSPLSLPLLSLQSWCYSANVVGGFIQGAGMAMANADLAIIPIQIGRGINEGWSAALGGIIGGILWTRVAPWIAQRRSLVPPPNVQSKTLGDQLGLSDLMAAVVYICLSVGMVVSLDWLGGGANRNESTKAGLFIAFAQVFSVLFARSTIGVSSAYEEFGKWFWYSLAALENCLKSRNTVTSSSIPIHGNRPSTSSIQFSIGIMIGSVLISTLFEIPQRYTYTLDQKKFWSVLGGAMMVFGSRLAGGCSSGHGLSGTGTLSLASFWTVRGLVIGGVTFAWMYSR